jgi:phage terminase large subunit-like protein
MHKPTAPHTLDFFGQLKWLDGRDLLDTIEPYRREFLTKALYSFREDGSPQYNQVVSGRAKKNSKSSDLVLAALYRLLAWESALGNDCNILANTEDQAGDDLQLATKLVRANPDTLGREVVPLVRGIRRKDGRGEIRILPAREAIGAHGKTSIFNGFDEIHGYRDWDIFEALAPDPTRTDALTWITSYDTLYAAKGVPLHDLKLQGFEGSDPRMLFSWYSGDQCTDPAFADLPPEQRANPSMGSWPEGPAYLEQQRRRLPTHKFRRLHLNLPGAPNGAFLDGDEVTSAIIRGLRRIPYEADRNYVAFVDMSGGSADDAAMAIAHKEDGDRRQLDVLITQDGDPPFSPRKAVTKFVRKLREYHITSVTGDAYAGLTFREDFEAEGIAYRVSDRNKTEIYEGFEPLLNAGEIELLDEPRLEEQLLSLVIRGARIDHQPGGHDDYANAACGALVLAEEETEFAMSREEREAIYREQQGNAMSDPLHGW